VDAGSHWESASIKGSRRGAGGGDNKSAIGIWHLFCPAGGRGKHLADRNIPVLLCDTPRILLRRRAFPWRRDTVPIGLFEFGGAIMNETMGAWTPRVLSVLRIVTGLLIIQHGMAKIIGFPVYPPYATVQPLSLIGAAGFIELIGGALLILGLWTQPVAFILSGEMAFAYFIAHFPKGFHPLINGGTLAILYCFTCLYLSTAGGGPWSVDASVKKN
jgi:putative oxidoreductase